MRILFLNQYFPPDDAPTGVLLAEVADSLREAGHEVELLNAHQPYRAGQATERRLQREFLALWRILWRGFSARRPDVIISGTSPPLLLIVATLLKLRFRARAVHWAMDLYPDLAVALGEIRPGVLEAILEGMMSWCYRRTDLTVALDADMAARLTALGARTECVRPWVPQPMWELARETPNRGDLPSGARPWTWIYSGNLGRAHDWETLLGAQQILEARGAGVRLLFQGGGPGSAQAKARAEDMGLRAVEWRPYAEKEEIVESLLSCDALIVTQRPETKGMLWPSKLALLLTLPRPLLFVGPSDGAIAAELKAIPHAGVFDPGDAEGVAAWVLKQQQDSRQSSAANVVDGGRHRTESLERWCGFIGEISNTGAKT